MTQLLDHQTGLHTQTLSYDARSQVVGAVNIWGQNQTYTYDGNGNRISSAGWETGDTSMTLSYAPGSHRLLSSVTGGAYPVTRAYAYDANGNEVQGSTGGYTSRLRTTTYGEDHRPATTAVTPSWGGPATTLQYRFNGLGQRVGKTVQDPYQGTTIRAFVYDDAGRLLAERGADGFVFEIVYLEDRPVGFVKYTEINGGGSYN